MKGNQLNVLHTSEIENSPSYELAVVPTYSEMQLVHLPDAQADQPSPSSLSCQVPFVSGVCPTCHRSLDNKDINSAVAPLGAQNFTPQYFRELKGVQQRCLSICENRSFFSAKMEGPEESDEASTACLPNANKQTEQFRENENEKQMFDDADEENCDIHGHYTGYYKRYFREIEKLGSGSYGGVYLCQHIMEGVSLGYFAVKKVPVGDNIEYLQKVLSEVRILEEVKRHPNVVEYHHSWVDIAKIADFGPRLRCLFILMEYATWGSLASFLEHYTEPLSTIAVWYLFLGALAGTAHLHRKNIIHRDLKPQNLLLTGERGKLPRVLVSDFGTAALLGELSYERTGHTGTKHYIAPELFICDQKDENKYIYRHTKASDVWSLGVTLHYLTFNRTLPVFLPNGDVVLSTADSVAYGRPPEMLELIRAMLRPKPTERPTCDGLLKSTVIQTIIQGLKRAKTFSDVFYLGTRATSASTVEEMDESRMSQDVVRKGVPISPVDKGAFVFGADKTLSCTHSSLEEVPLLLQYKMLEESVKSPAGILSFTRSQAKSMVEKAVQTDHVKIVYE